MTDSEMPHNAMPRRKRRILRFAGYLLLFCFLAMIAGELFCRYYLRLGDPPLFVLDREIEYMMKPSRTYNRFGNRIHYNQWSMRSEDFPRNKTSPDELRVLVVGDSVVNGGAQSDQSQLITTLLETELEADLHRPVTVGNVSCPSWGPPNELAYLKRFGLFDADVVVLVYSSHDAGDVPAPPEEVKKNLMLVQQSPPSALYEAVVEYLPRYVPILRIFTNKYDPFPILSAEQTEHNIQWCMRSVKETVELARSGGASVVAALHLSRDECNGTIPIQQGHDQLLEVLKKMEVPTIELGEPFQVSINKGKYPYRDEIHLNAVGQRLIADVLKPVILNAIRNQPPATSPAATRN